MSTHHVTVRRDGRFWYVEVAGVGVTQARHLREVDVMARDLVAVLTDADPDSVELDVHLVLDETIQARLDIAEELRTQAAEAQAQAAAEVREAARALRAQGMPLRDVGQVLGVSHQRAHQLVQGSPQPVGSGDG